MKKLETLKKALETVTDETLAAIIANEDVAIDTLTAADKLSVLMYEELAKALKTKEHQLLLDCNYADSKNVQNGVMLVDYYRLAAHGSMIQVYVKRNAFNICTSASKANREQFAALEDLQFVTKYDKKTGRAKTTQRNGISYEELVPIIKSVIAVLGNTASTKAKPEPTEE